jgi:hypothetical protein
VYSKTITISDTTSLPTYFVVTSNGTSVYIYVNEQAVASDTLSIDTPVAFTDVRLLNNLSLTSGFKGNFFELACADSFCEISAVEKIQSYLRTKYFLLG